MKKTKMIVAVGMAVLMVLSVGSIAMAAPGPNIGQDAAQPGYSDSTVTLEISDKDPINLSATVPIYIPLAMKKGTVESDAPKVYAPTDVRITNTSTCPVDGSTDVTDADLAIKVSGIRAMIDQTGARTWSIAAAPTAVAGDANKMQLKIAGSTFGDLAATSQGQVSVTPDAASGLSRIEKDEYAGITVEATAGGTNKEYSEAAAANLFKVRFMIEAGDPA